VVRRPHLSILPAYAVRPVRLPSSRKVLAVASAGCVVLGLLYLAARETPLFAVRTIEISGAPRKVRAEIIRSTKPYMGRSLVSLDGDELRARLEALPSVRSLRSDRAFPHTLRIVVVPEKPAAVLRAGQDGWLVSARGRIIRRLLPKKLGERPRIRLPGRVTLSPGQRITDRSTMLALRVVAAVPHDFPTRIHSVRAREGLVTIVLAGDVELRLGEGTAVALKLAVAAEVLHALSAEERATLGYLDLTVPDRAVAGDKPQVSG
jgi:cell division septal protein FtsQ